MFRKTLLLIIATLLLSVCFTGQLTQGQSQEKLFYFIVQVDSADKVLKKTVEMHVYNALRSINDVEVNTDTHLAAYSMSIVANEQKHNLTGKTGYISVAFALSEVFYPYHNLKWSLSEEKCKQATTLIKEAEFPLFLLHHRDTFLITCEIKDLSTFCQKIIKTIDKEVISEQRSLLVREVFGLPPKE